MNKEEKFFLIDNNYHRLTGVYEWNFGKNNLDYWNGDPNRKSRNSTIFKFEHRRDLVDCLCRLLELAEKDYEISIDYEPDISIKSLEIMKKTDTYIIKVKNPMVIDDFDKLIDMFQENVDKLP